MDWTDRNVLVTGASGFIGGHVAHALVRLGANVRCLVCEMSPRSWFATSGCRDEVTIISGRVEDGALLRAALVENEIDAVFHLAARTLVGAAHRDPAGTFETNIRGTWQLLEACRVAGGVRSIVIASSDKAYGDAEALPYTESLPLDGRFPYDVSKACCDMLAQSYVATWGLPIAIARCGNVFGPGDLNFSRLVPGTIRALLRGERPVVRSDGSPRRDYLAVSDAVSAYLALAAWAESAAAPWPQRAFNFGPSRPMTVLEMIRRIQAAAGRPDLEPSIEHTARCEIRDQHLDASRARDLLGWRCKEDLDALLVKTVAWYREHDAQAGPRPVGAGGERSEPVIVHAGDEP
jgi:CDP-glucose 4,6-dehydratase